MKQQKAILIMFFVLLGLGGLATWDEWKTEEEASQQKSKNRLTGDELANAERIEIRPSAKDQVEGKSAEEIVLVRGDQWMLEEPIQAVADGETVEQFLKSLQDYAYSKVVADSADGLEKFGLAEPSNTDRIKITGKDKVYLDLEVGSNAPLGYSIYLKRRSESKVFIGGQHLRLIGNKTPIDFRQKNLFELKEITELDFVKVRKNGALEFLVAKDRDSFKLEGPRAKMWPADDFKVRDFLRKIESIAFDSFVDSTQSKAYQRLLKEQSLLSLSLNNLAVDFRPHGEFFAVHLPKHNSFGVVSPEVLSSVDESLENLTSKKFWQDSYSTAVKVRVGQAWISKSDGPDGGDLWTDTKGEKVDLGELLTELEFSDAEKVLPKSMVSQSLLKGKPFLTLTFGFEDDTSSKLVFLPDPDSNEKVFVYSEAADFIYLSDRAAISSLSSLQNLAKGISLVPADKKAG